MNRLEIVIGTYEEFLLGYRWVQKDGKDTLTQTFADKSHSAGIRCLGVLDHWVATGSADDRIFVYDMKARKQSQIILTHEGTVNSLAFVPEGSHLLSVADDGDMVCTRLNTWITEAKWKKAHKGSHVTHVSCHPSGKLALSLGSDLVLRTWNLVKGRVAYKKNLKSRNTLGSHPDCLAWSLGGDHFSLTGLNVIEIWSIQKADVVFTQKTTSKPVSIAWLTNEICLVGLENGKVQWIDLAKKDQESPLIEVHAGRVKAMSFYQDHLVTASSNGEVKLWSVDLEKVALKEVASTNIGCRPTCIGILDLGLFTTAEELAKIGQDKGEEKVQAPVSKPKPQVRGVVKIEYENDEDKEGESDNEEDDNEDDDDDTENADDDDDEDAENNEEADNDEEEEDTPSEDSDTDEDEAPQIRLPKSRKHKQMAQQAEVKSKKFKTEAKPKKVRK